MDNEEIRELLQELKETSDESTAVKSRVVKIHFDTRKEAEARARQKEKAREEEEQARRKREEEEREKQEEAGRKAEEETEKLVNEAKAEASAAFSPDLEKDIGMSGDPDGTDGEDTEGGEEDLDLNWDPRKTPGMGRYLGGLEDTDDPDTDTEGGETDAPGSGNGGSSADADPDRRETDEEENGSFPERILRSVRRGTAGLMRRLAGRDEEKDTGKDSSDEDRPEDSEAETAVSASSDVEMREITAPEDTDGESEPQSAAEPEKETDQGSGSAAEDDWKRRMEEPPRFNLRHVRIPDMPVRKRTRHESGDAAGEDTQTKAPEDAQTKASEDTQTKVPEDTQTKAPEDARMQSSEEERKPKRRRHARGIFRRGKASGSGRKSAERDLSVDDFESDEADFRTVPQSEEPGRKKPAAHAETETKDDTETAVYRKMPPAEDTESTENSAAHEDTAAASVRMTAAQETENPAIHNETETAGDGGTAPAYGGTRKPEEAPEVPAAARSAGEAAPEEGPRSIEMVNLNENANHKQVEVISLDRNETGPIPDLSSGQSGRGRRGKKHEGSGKKTGRTRRSGRTEESAGRAAAFFGSLTEKIRGSRDRNRKTAEKRMSLSEILGSGAAGSGSAGTAAVSGTGPLSGKRRFLTVCILAAAGIVLAGLLIFWAVRSGESGKSSSSGSGITADEGLTVRIRKQPMEYTTEGDVTLTVRVPKTIQSITVDGSSVAFSGDKKTEITCHAEKGTLKLMVVSTDKVRSATVKLAYVDSEPPSVSVRTSGTTVTLSAKDDGSGVEGIYYGTCGPASDVPLYQKYTQPFEEDGDTVYSWYAVDRAGNMSAPVSGTFTRAESMSFARKSYQVFPDQTVTLRMRVKPENAYLNNLTFSSSDEKVVRIEQGNVLAPVSEGTAQVTASADGLDPVTVQVTVSDAKTVTISAVGDCTLGTDPNLAQDTSFVAYETLYGSDYFFRNVKDLLQQDDVTLANFEGTLTTSEQRQNKQFTFKGDPSYTEILKDGSVEVVTLANNHSGDYGEQGLADTEQNLTDAGIEWCSGDDIAYEQINGIKCAFIGIYAVENGQESLPQVKSTIAEAKREEAQIIVVDFHWNSELVEDPNQDMIALGHAAVDAGADLVVGSHSHMVSGIEKYEGKYIVYGLGNFCFGGNLYPRDYDAMIFRQTFTVDGNGTADDDSIEIIPVRISSAAGYNNYQPTPVSGSEADQIMQKINARSAQFGSTWDSYMADGTAA